jgi:hypothetical protein
MTMMPPVFEVTKIVENVVMANTMCETVQACITVDFQGRKQVEGSVLPNFSLLDVSDRTKGRTVFAKRAIIAKMRLAKAPIRMPLS